MFSGMTEQEFYDEHHMSPSAFHLFVLKAQVGMPYSKGTRHLRREALRDLRSHAADIIAGTDRNPYDEVQS